MPLFSMRFWGHSVSTVLMFILIHQWPWRWGLWWVDRESLKNSLCGGKKQKQNIEILHQRNGERRGSFEPVACQSFPVFLCEEMSESSLFLLYATSPKSLGKRAAQVGEKFVDFERGKRKKKIIAFELL